jgi:uncharacterized protein (TIGR00369 family)
MREPLNPDPLDFVKDYVAAQDFLCSINTTLESIDTVRVILKVPFNKSLSQHTGAFHGGVIGALSEAVLGACASTVVGKDQTVLGAEYKVNFLSPAIGKALIAQGEVMKAARSLTVCRATVKCLREDGTLKVVSIAQGTMANVSAKLGHSKA